MVGNNEKWNWKGNNKTFWIGILLSLLLTIITYFVLNSLNSPYEIRDLVAIFTGLIIVTTLFFYSKIYSQNFEKHEEILQFEREKFEYQKSIREENINIRKLKYSFEITGEWHRPNRAIYLQKIKLFFNTIRNSDGSLKSGKEFDKEINLTADTRTALMSILNYFEHVCILIEEDFADEEAIKKAFKHIFNLFLTETEDYIKYRQTKEKSKSIYKNFLKYSLKWSAES